MLSALHILFSSFSFAEQNSTKTIHVFVALADNKHQNIVPVGRVIGNGQDAFNNLYWGALYGVKNYFHKISPNWKLVETIKNPSPFILERVIFKEKSGKAYMVADAYDGRYIKKTIEDYIQATNGQNKETLTWEGQELSFGGGAHLTAYIGHNGLMDFSIVPNLEKNTNTTRDTIILACYSQSYFYPWIAQMDVKPILWTKSLMAPEAYSLEGAINSWLNGDSHEKILNAAISQYAKYQKISFKAAATVFTASPSP